MSDPAPLYRADDPAFSCSVELEGLTILFHRPSGMTHVLAPPAPQILELLRERGMTADVLKTRMAERFEVAGDAAALASRLDELAVAGLVERR